MALGLGLALCAAAEAQVFYTETFDADLGTLRAHNDGDVSTAGAYDATCPAAPLADHSAPGTAHWTNPTTCLDYGGGFSSDALSTGRIEVPAECGGGVRLEFNYYLDFEEGACYDRARVEVYVDGSGPLVVSDNGGCDAQNLALAERPSAPEGGGGDPGFGNLANAAAWRATATLISGATPGTLLEVQFIGETDDDLFNSGEGFYVDDVVLSCQPRAYEIPALGASGFAALGALLATAAFVVLARRRRA
jgi:hypothetical protein